MGRLPINQVLVTTVLSYDTKISLEDRKKDWKSEQRIKAIWISNSPFLFYKIKIFNTSMIYDIYIVGYMILDYFFLYT